MPYRRAEVFAEIAQRVVDAVTEFDLRVEASAKAELYYGHGKRTGNLQRAIFGDTARLEGMKVKGRIGVRGVVYALPVHRRYKYITNGFDKERPNLMSIIQKHAGKR